MLTLLYFEEGQAPAGARRLTLLPTSEWELFEGQTGVQMRLFKDAETGEPLWFHATLALDENVGAITTAKEGGVPADLYLLPVVETK